MMYEVHVLFTDGIYLNLLFTLVSPMHATLGVKEFYLEKHTNTMVTLLIWYILFDCILNSQYC